MSSALLDAPERASGSNIVLDPVLDLTAAEPLCRTLRDGLLHGAIDIDGSRVERVATPCLQVLAAAARRAAELGIPFCIAAPSADLSSAITELGLAALIPLES